MAVTLTNRPTLIETEDKKLRFLIMDAPSDSNLPLYLKEFKNHNVTHVVRVCQETYRKETVVAAGIKFHDMPFDDGSSPPSNIINTWLDLVDDVFPPEDSEMAGSQKASSSGKKLKQNRSTSDLSDHSSLADGGGSGADGNGNGNGAVPPSPTASAPASTTTAGAQKQCIAIHCVAGLGRAPVLVAIALMERTGMQAEDAVAFIRKKRRGAINATQLAFVQRYTPRRKKKCVIM